MMKAMIATGFGQADKLKLMEVPRPSPKPHDVLVQIHATSLNRSDWELQTGWLLGRVSTVGLTKKQHIWGSDIAGVVVEVGAEVEQFQVGDAVFGDVLTHLGGLAEFGCYPADELAAIPAGLTFEQAAAIPQAGVIALQAIRDKGDLQAGDRILINGAGGGAGAFAMQLAKQRGAEITAVDAARKFDHLRRLGADHVIDYTQQDFAKLGREYDFILDVIATRPASAIRRALTPTGSYYMVGASTGMLLRVTVGGWLRGLFNEQKIRLLPVMPNTTDLLTVAEMVANGSLSAEIDTVYPLADAADAMACLGAGRANGKLVVTMPASQS